MEEPGGLQSLGVQRVRHARATSLSLSRGHSELRQSSFGKNSFHECGNMVTKSVTNTSPKISGKSFIQHVFYVKYVLGTLLDPGHAVMCISVQSPILTTLETCCIAQGTKLGILQ